MFYIRNKVGILFGIVNVFMLTFSTFNGHWRGGGRVEDRDKEGQFSVPQIEYPLGGSSIKGSHVYFLL